MEKNDFIREFTGFTTQCRREGVDASMSDITTLFAIYRKDLRTERLGSNYVKASNGGQRENSGEKASPKQVQYLKDLAERRGVRIAESDVLKMTREEASRAIEELREGA